jgi:aspartate aminotransferase
MSTPESGPLAISDRVRHLAESATIAAGARAAALKAQGKDVLAFAMGEPDFVTPEPIRRAAIAAIERGLTHYAPTAGDRECRAAIAAKLKRENGIDCAAEHITVTVGAKHAVYLALQTLLDVGKGQEVILPTPAWVSYRPLIELAGGTCVEVAGAMANGFKITPDELERAITPRTVAVLFNSPSNPCGTTYTPAEIAALAAALERHPQLTVISDEIYEKLVYPEVTPGLRAVSFGSFPALANRTVTVNGMSKAFAMTGWRIGYLCCPGGGGRFTREAIKLQAQMTNGIPTFLMPAIVEALGNGAPGVEEMRKRFAARAKLMHAGLAAIPRLKCAASDGAFYSFPDISGCLGLKTPAGRSIGSGKDFADALLDEALVSTVSGEEFGACARNHIRLSFACSEEAIARGLERIGSFVASLR